MDYKTRRVKGQTYCLLIAEDNEEKLFLYHLEKQVIDNGKHLEFISSTRIGIDNGINSLELMLVKK